MWLLCLAVSGTSAIAADPIDVDVLLKGGTLFDGSGSPGVIGDVGIRKDRIVGIGKFQVVGQLGTGAHSTILHVRRSADARNYALKVVPIDEPDDHKFLEQARHEFRVAQLLDHPIVERIGDRRRVEVPVLVVGAPNDPGERVGVEARQPGLDRRRVERLYL